ncbi:hypothetical protein BJP25_26620 [Actinokineospora bangkokensis]|uniref:CdiI C-terminal domain-containing protein n=2 Tax=Actinokineospora bangkokensis TaxID=1193682 RepID=A0A1Q9LH42_9PSEU|nr:hypothetical protein BJP25_26620 [Actinokineospora bangkokensis]
MSTAHWQPQDYRNSWALALRELLAAEVVDSCLVTSITEPAMSNFISCWPLYRRGEKVHVQEALIFLDVLEVPFDEHRPWLSVRPRRTVSEDGLAISEWVTSVGDVREFARTLGTAEGGEVDDGLREDLRG